MKTLQKYLFREWLGSFLAISVVMLFVVVSTYAGDLLSDVARGNIPASLLATQLLFRIPDALTLILPLSMFIAIMFSLGRLYRDQEMAVMYACGFRWNDLLRPLALLCLPLSVLLLANSFLLGPKGQAQADEMLQQAFRQTAIWGLRAGDFHSLHDGRMVIYVESINEAGDELSNIFIHMYGSDEARTGTDQTWTAETGRYWFDEVTGSRYIRLSAGQVTEHNTDTGRYQRIEFTSGDLKLPDQEAVGSTETAASKNLSTLLADASTESFAEIHWRLSPAIAIVLLSLLALPLAHSAPRDGRYGRLVLGLLVYVVYVNLLTLGRVWLNNGSVPAPAGLWWVHAGLLFLIIAWTRAHLHKARG